MLVRAKWFFWPCASVALSLGSRVESGSEKTTIENRQKGNGVTGRDYERLKESKGNGERRES